MHQPSPAAAGFQGHRNLGRGPVSQRQQFRHLTKPGGDEFFGKEMVWRDVSSKTIMLCCWWLIDDLLDFLAVENGAVGVKGVEGAENISSTTKFFTLHLFYFWGAGKSTERFREQ